MSTLYTTRKENGAYDDTRGGCADGRDDAGAVDGPWRTARLAKKARELLVLERRLEHDRDKTENEHRARYDEHEEAWDRAQDAATVAPVLIFE